MDFESLRRRAAQIDLEKQIAGERESLQEQLRREEYEAEERRREQIKANVESSSRFMESSNFPDLLEEFSDLLQTTESGYLSIYHNSIPDLVSEIEGTKEYDHKALNTKRKFRVWESPYTPNPSNDYYFGIVNLSLTQTELAGKIPKSLTRLLARIESTKRGVAFEATPDGIIIAHGAEAIRLPLGQWQGNSSLQQQVFEKVVNNPFKLRQTVVTSYDWKPGPYDHPGM